MVRRMLLALLLCAALLLTACGLPGGQGAPSSADRERPYRAHRPSQRD